MIDKKLEKKIVSWMKKHFPNEGCGLILKDGSFIGCENVINKENVRPDSHHVAKDTSFMIDFNVFIKYSGQIQAIVHSHVTDNDTGPSNMDKMHMEASGVLWYIFVLNTKKEFVEWYEIK